MTIFAAVLLLATFLCSLVAGFLFAFAVVVMPGIRSLDDGAFLRAFQVIDRVIQNSQPLFILVWVGSVLAVIAAAVLALWNVDGVNRLLVVLAALIYVLAVQVPTATVNIPLNNAVKRLDVNAADEGTRQRARAAFEPRWNRWNDFRTVCAGVTTLLLLLVMLRL